MQVCSPVTKAREEGEKEMKKKGKLQRKSKRMPKKKHFGDTNR
jgi:hypothetical protein